MWSIIRSFLRGLSPNWAGALGIALTTSSFVVFVVLETFIRLGFISNAYVGLLSYMTLPALFVFGLVLIAFGLFLARRRSDLPTRAFLSSRFGEEQVQVGYFGANVFVIVAGLTVANLLFVGGASTTMLGFMDKPDFCGTACHVMNPEWTAYQESPHARVACVSCHVGDSTEALVESKLSGLRQMLLFTAGAYSTPIPTPVEQLRPSRETCRTCHWAGVDHGSRIRTFVTHDSDEGSTPRFTTLSLKVGSAEGEPGTIHWHASPSGEVRYAAADARRQRILWVEAKGKDGSVRRWENQRHKTADEGVDAHARSVDCVDCHNRVAHLFEGPERGIDARIADGRLERSLPFIKREALSAVLHRYPDDGAAMDGIELSLKSFYRRHYPNTSVGMSTEIDAAVEVTQAFYARNVYPEMGIGWGTYDDRLGHTGRGDGCFRCHSNDLVDEEGNSIDDECTICHSILAEESERPFAFADELATEGDPNSARHAYLRGEFLHSIEGGDASTVD